MGKAIGIDLGTTNSVVAFRTNDTKVLQNREAQDLTPSVVGWHKQKEIVGSLAVDRMVMSPRDTIISVKRLMGRGYRDDEVQKVRKKYQYDIRSPKEGTDDDVRVVLNGKEYSPIQVSSLILKKLKEDAELRLGDTVEYAVITVPAYFTEKQKDATRKAGQLAGLKVQKILDEPTAAAIAFGIDNLSSDDAKTVLVYDLGGGTFDVSVLTIVGGVFAQLDIEGDMWLGGDDFDHKIMQHVVEHIRSVHNLDATTDPKFMVELKKKAEQAKKSLGAMTSVDISIPDILKDGEGDLIEVEMEITRAQFERMIASDVKRSVELVKQAIKNAGQTMTTDEIDQVLLVGGSSQIPLVRKSLAEVFGEKKILSSVDPMKCVAYGAAILAAKFAEKVECPRGHINPGKNLLCDFAGCGEPLIGTGANNVVPAEVTGMHYGIESEGDKFAIVIPKGSPFPTPEPVVKPFFTPTANLRRIRVPIYAGFNDKASQNELQATIWLELPDQVPADTPLDVAFSLDADGILEKVKVDLKDGSGTSVETFLDRGDNKRGRLEKKIEQIKKRMQEMREPLDSANDAELERNYSEATKALSANNPDRAEQAARKMESILDKAGPSGPAWKVKAENLVGYTEQMLEHCGWLIDTPQTMRLKKLIEEVRSALNRQDQALTERKTEELDKETDDVPVPVRMLIMLAQAGGRAAEAGDEIKADRIRNESREIQACMRRGDHAEAVRRFDALNPMLKEIFGATPKFEQKGGAKEGLVKSR